MEKHTWVSATLARLMSYDRYELGLLVADKVVGGVTLVEDDDVHVGRCLTVASQYVLPEYRNTGCSMLFMREAVRLARNLSMPVLAYTHRLGDWTYKTTYRRIM